MQISFEKNSCNIIIMSENYMSIKVTRGGLSAIDLLEALP